jgi:hypothetical protein
MRRGKPDLVNKRQKSLLKLPQVTRNNTSTRNSSPTNTGIKNPLRFPKEINKKPSLNKPLSRSASSQPVIRIMVLLFTLILLSQFASAAWANSSFDKCMDITINNSGSETLTNFPSYLNLTYDSDMLPDFKDIRFYNASCSNDGSLMDYEIENYTTSTRAHIWIRIPSLPSTGKIISIYYKNNTAVTSGQNPAGVWDGNYQTYLMMSNQSSYVSFGAEQSQPATTVSFSAVWNTSKAGSAQNMIVLPITGTYTVDWGNKCNHGNKK